ncbi:MAG TPA: hypothetical protein DEQ20_10485 [Desulfobulbaceae bacterium]|nr:hypothetical protein [Desulfobulbaceae bacterium]
MEDLLNPITGLTAKERKCLLSWVASLPEEQVIGIFQDGVKKSFQLQKERPDLSGKINKYCAFVVAARRAGWDTIKGKGYRVAQKEQYEDFTHLRRAKTAELLQRGRTPVLRRKILAYWGEIKELKIDGMGFRPIADYLRKTRKLKVSPSYLMKLWHEVEENA